MNSEQITAFLQEHWYIASVLIGAVILIGAIRNWNWLCDPTGEISHLAHRPCERMGGEASAHRDTLFHHRQ